MWLRLRLDIAWGDIGWGFLYALWPGNRGAEQIALETEWSGNAPDALACLSVRSGFDLLLQALDLSRGSEVLFSALTIPDMPAIAARHGLVPVPVDVGDNDFHVDLDALRRAITPRTRLLVIAHLMGARPDCREAIELARGQGLLVVEDCAQAWHGRSWRGDPAADVSLFSFGPIKTATCLGGGLCRIADPALLERMRSIQAQQAVQRTSAVLARLAKYALLKALSPRLVIGGIVRLAGWRGVPIDRLLGGLTRGFVGADLLVLLRRQPAIGLLRLLRRRLRSYDTRRIEERIGNARIMTERLGLSGSAMARLGERHAYWLFPILTEAPPALRASLLAAGFDSAQRGSMFVLGPPPGRQAQSAVQAQALLERLVLLPCYPEMQRSAVHALCDAVLAHERKHHRIICPASASSRAQG